MDPSENLKRQLAMISASQEAHLRKALNPLAEHLSRQNDQFSRMAELLNPTKAFADAMASFTSRSLLLPDLSELSRVALPRIDLTGLQSMFSSISRSMSEFAQSLAELNPYLARAAVLFAKHGWWVVDALPVSIYVKLAKSEKTVTERELTDLIVRFANQNRGRALVEMVESWNVEAFERREPIFRDALWAHKRKKYTLTVPTLIPHLEGIVRDVVGPSKRARNGFRAVRTKFRNKFKQLGSAPSRRHVTYEDVRALENFYNLGALEQLYKHFAPGVAGESGLNRHGIAHGVWVNYASIEASTRLFLLLDMLHSMLEQLEKS